MKTIEDLSQEELLALDDEMRVVMIDRECAKDGVPLLPKIQDAPVKPDIEPDVTAFSVDATMRFGRKEDADHIAMELATLQRFTTDYLLGTYSYSGPKCLTPLDKDDVNDVRVNLEHFWSREKYDLHRVELQAYTDAKKEWDTEKKEYNDILKKRERAISFVQDLIGSAYDKRNLEQSIRTTFEEYKSLAGGDEEIALGFLIKAGRWNEDDIRDTLLKPKLITEGVADNGTEEDDGSSESRTH